MTKEEQNLFNSKLDILFSELRLKEGIEVGEISSKLNSEDIHHILCNRRWKKENNIKLSDLEEVVAEESGFLIRSFIAKHHTKVVEKMKNDGVYDSTVMPFPSWNVTIKQLTEAINGYCLKMGARTE